MPLETSLEEAVSEPDITKIIFRHVKSQRAARIFIDWLKFRQGSCTHSELNRFSHALACGRFSEGKLGRSNFYRTVLRRLMNLGLVEIRPQYDHERRRVIKVYGAIHQPVPKRRPTPGCFWRLAFDIAQKWNEEFRPRRRGFEG